MFFLRRFFSLEWGGSSPFEVLDQPKEQIQTKNILHFFCSAEGVGGLENRSLKSVAKKKKRNETVSNIFGLYLRTEGVGGRDEDLLQLNKGCQTTVHRKKKNFFLLLFFCSFFCSCVQSCRQRLFNLGGLGGGPLSFLKYNTKICLFFRVLWCLFERPGGERLARTKATENFACQTFFQYCGTSGSRLRLRPRRRQRLRPQQPSVVFCRASKAKKTQLAVTVISNIFFATMLGLYIF